MGVFFPLFVFKFFNQNRMMKYLFLSLIALFSSYSLFASSLPLALIYKGPGSCVEDCSESAARIAKKAGLKTQFVGPGKINPDLLKKAKIWIQPGGSSSKAAAAMGIEQLSQIREFVLLGGGYVGFCAGGFLTTEKIGNTQNDGLGIIKGNTHLYEEVPDQATMLNIQWNQKNHHLYWEGGPYFIKDPSDTLSKVTAYYPNHSIASLFSTYGSGKISITGLHPEAPLWWRTSSHLIDEDGLDDSLAIEMIQSVL